MTHKYVNIRKKGWWKIQVKMWALLVIFLFSFALTQLPSLPLDVGARTPLLLLLLLFLLILISYSERNVKEIYTLMNCKSSFWCVYVTLWVYLPTLEAIWVVELFIWLFFCGCLHFSSLFLFALLFSKRFIFSGWFTVHSLLLNMNLKIEWFK